MSTVSNSTTFTPVPGGLVVVTLRSAPGSFAPLLGWEGDCPVVLAGGRAHVLAPEEPREILTQEKAAEVDLDRWKVTRRQQLVSSRRNELTAAVRAQILGQLRVRYAVAEIDKSLSREGAETRAEVLRTEEAHGRARRVGGREVFALAEPYGDFVPAEDDAERVLVAGSSAVPDGTHVLLGFVADDPVVLRQTPAEVRGVVVLSGRWTHPGAESAASWIARTREEVARETAPSATGIRARVLDKLQRERVIVPVDTGEQFACELLEREGWCRPVGDGGAYALAREVS